jgi:hypothetical protein
MVLDEDIATTGLWRACVRAQGAGGASVYVRVALVIHNAGDYISILHIPYYGGCREVNMADETRHPGSSEWMGIMDGYSTCRPSQSLRAGEVLVSLFFAFW